MAIFHKLDPKPIISCGRSMIRRGFNVSTRFLWRKILCSIKLITAGCSVKSKGNATFYTLFYLKMSGKYESKAISSQIFQDGKFSGLFAGWGGTRIIAMKASKEGDLSAIADTNGDQMKTGGADQVAHEHKEHDEVKLRPVYSTAIAGCDLMSSGLYTAGICANSSGKLAPICLTLVTIMLYYFRLVYSEVVTAIPVNGGTYNVLLNTANKKLAGFVACLSILSYVATAILSAFDAIIYLELLWPDVDIRGFTILIMCGFGLVTICGVGESAIVNTVIFTIHMTILTLLIIWCFAHGAQDGFALFRDNLDTPYPDLITSEGELLAKNSAGYALYFGYCSALLGITGFESAANYVEEMRDPGVFVTTVNWLWFFVGVYNPLISVVAMMVMSMDDIYEHSGDMLAFMANEVGGTVFRTILCVDAVIILCGAVITSIIGVSGLLKRLANDKVLPQFLSWTNSRGAGYANIIAFVILSVSLFLAIYDPKDPGAIDAFGGVYTIAFLSVLTAFAIAAIMLKLYRPRLARLVIAPWWTIFLSLTTVFIGLIGNIVLAPEMFNLFLIYMTGFLSVVAYMFMKVEIFSFGIWMLRKMNLSEDKRVEARNSDIEILEACEKQSKYDERQLFLSTAHDIEMQEVQLLPPAVAAPATDSAKLSHSAAGNILMSFKKMANRASFGSTSSLQHPDDHHHHHHHSTTHAHEPSSDHVLTWGEGIITNVRRRLSFSGHEDSATHVDHPVSGSHNSHRRRSASVMELEGIMVRPVMGRALTYLMHSLDNIVSQPFVYLAKGSDPISVHLAVEYICANELSNNIYVVHFVDDSKAIRLHNTFRNRVNKEVKFGTMDKDTADKKSNLLLMQMFTDGAHSLGSNGENVHDDVQFELNSASKTLSSTAKRLVYTVSILDTFYTYKKIHCIIVRGAYFCPSAVDCLSKHLNVSKNSMIMGVPDAKFPFPFAQLRGVRLAVPQPDAVNVSSTVNHLRELLGDAAFNASMKGGHIGGDTVAVHEAQDEALFDISQLKDAADDEEQGESHMVSVRELSGNIVRTKPSDVEVSAIELTVPRKRDQGVSANLARGTYSVVSGDENSYDEETKRDQKGGKQAAGSSNNNITIAAERQISSTDVLTMRKREGNYNNDI